MEKGGTKGSQQATAVVQLLQYHVHDVNHVEKEKYKQRLQGKDKDKDKENETKIEFLFVY